MNRAVAISLLLALAACGKPANPEITVSNGWARATAEGQTTGAVYLTIANGGAADRLTGASTDRAAMAMIHRSENQDGVARMRMAHGLEIPAGGSVVLAPGGTHVMLEGLKGPLVAGSRFDLQLTFDKSGRMVVPIAVVAAGER